MGRPPTPSVPPSSRGEGVAARIDGEFPITRANRADGLPSPPCGEGAGGGGNRASRRLAPTADSSGAGTIANSDHPHRDPSSCSIFPSSPRSDAAKIASERRDCNARDLLAEAVLDLLDDAGIDSLDAVQHGLASYESDHFNMQMTLGAILQDTIGMTPKPSLRVEGGGATGALALRTAWAHIQSGLCDSILVYGVEKNGRGVSSRTANQLFALSADVDWETAIGGTYTGFYAAMMRAHMAKYGTREEHFAHVAVRNRANAAFNPIAQKPMQLSIDDVLASRPVAEPYKLLDCSLLSDGAACVLLSSEAWAREHVAAFDKRAPVYFHWHGLRHGYHGGLGDRYPNITNFPRQADGGAGRPIRWLELTIPCAKLMSPSYTTATAAWRSRRWRIWAGWRAEMAGRRSPTAHLTWTARCRSIRVADCWGGARQLGQPASCKPSRLRSRLWGEVDPRRQVSNARLGLTDTHAGIASISRRQHLPAAGLTRSP